MSKKPDITRKIQRITPMQKKVLSVAAAPKFEPEDMPTGTVPIHVELEQKRESFIARAPKSISSTFLCNICGQRITKDGCLCKFL